MGASILRTANTWVLAPCEIPELRLQISRTVCTEGAQAASCLPVARAYFHYIDDVKRKVIRIRQFTVVHC